jgi:hypothetical protein
MKTLYSFGTHGSLSTISCRTGILEKQTGCVSFVDLYTLTEENKI